MAAPRARLLPWIAAERAIRGLLLVGVGIYLLSQPNANLGSLATRLARRVELDPDHGFVHHLIVRVSALDHRQITLIGAGAIAYGLLENGRGRRPLAAQTLGRVANRNRNIAARRGMTSAPREGTRSSSGNISSRTVASAQYNRPLVTREWRIRWIMQPR